MKRWVYTVLIIVLSAIFLVSSYFVADYVLQSLRQKSTFRELSQIKESAATHTLTEKTDPAEDISQPTEPLLVEVTDPETGEIIRMLPEFAELYLRNNDIVGWISIDGTAVNYPVMQNSAYTDYYLYLDFDEVYSRHGCIYVREKCDVFTPSDNVVIYGHRMGDGTMFNALLDYTDKAFYDAHPIISFDTLLERHTYEIVAIFATDVYADSFAYHTFVDAENKEQFDDFMENCLSRAYYDTGVRATYGDKLITLSTCEYTHANGRLVVVAKQIS